MIRSDYVTPLYSTLGVAAILQWRSSPIFSPHYHESGIAITYNPVEPPNDGEGYACASLANSRTPEGTYPPHIELLSSKSDVQRIMQPANGSGSKGFVNSASGWADASGAMGSLRAHVHDLGLAHGNFHWSSEHVSSLIFSSPPQAPCVTGARLTSGDSLCADITVLAAGAWSGKLLDLRGRMQATAQILAYVQLQPLEAKELAKIPVLLNLSTGFFMLPPTSEGVLKIARHTQGWRNEVRIPHPELAAQQFTKNNASEARIEKIEAEIKASIPASNYDTLPPSSVGPMRAFLEETVPALKTRVEETPFCATKVCWYSDTPTGDFIVDWVPNYGRSLFVATGGSGHAFKFLPVLGESILERMGSRGRLKQGIEKNEADLWRWRERSQGEMEVSDGSRGGAKGLRWEDENWGEIPAGSAIETKARGYEVKSRL